MRALGADVVEHGRDFDEARERVEERRCRVKDGDTCIRRTNRTSLPASARMPLEIFDELPDADYLFVPVGGGSGAAGCCIVRGRQRASRAKIVGVQAAGARMPSPDRGAGPRAWSATRRVHTCADGIATRTTYDLTFAILKAQLDEVVTLEEEELGKGFARRCGSRTTWRNPPAPPRSPRRDDAHRRSRARRSSA